MIPAPSYDQIVRILNEDSFRLGRGFAQGVPRATQTVGFILFDQNFGRNSIQDLVGNLDMLHLHSGTHIHFFLCGVSKFGPNNSEGRELGELNGVTLYHNAEALHSFVTAFEREIGGWTYDLGFELVLVDVFESGNDRQLDFSSAVFFKVDELIRVGIIDRPSDLFGKFVWQTCEIYPRREVRECCRIQGGTQESIWNELAEGPHFGNVSKISREVGTNTCGARRGSFVAGIAIRRFLTIQTNFRLQ